MNPTNDPRSDAKLQNLAERDAQFAEDMWRFRHPDEDGEKLSYVAILAALPKLCGYTVALSTLHSFYRWLELKRDMDAATETAEQVMARLSEDPMITHDQLDGVASKVFKLQALQKQDPKTYCDMMAALVQKQRAQAEERKISILEAKARRLDELEAKAKEIRSGGGLSAESLELLEKQLKIL